MKYFIFVMSVSLPCVGSVQMSPDGSKYNVDQFGKPLELPYKVQNVKYYDQIEYDNHVPEFSEKEMKAYESLKAKGVWIW